MKLHKIKLKLMKVLYSFRNDFNIRNFVSYDGKILEFIFLSFRYFFFYSYSSIIEIFGKFT
jgi:hypothetical protein